MNTMDVGLLAIGAGLAIGLAALATGYAQARIGAAGIGALPLDREDFIAAISETLSADKLAVNLTAYDMGVGMVQ